MESLLLRALESTLRYWLKTFSRDQFKLRGRSIHLHNLGKGKLFSPHHRKWKKNRSRIVLIPPPQVHFRQAIYFHFVCVCVCVLLLSEFLHVLNAIWGFWFIYIIIILWVVVQDVDGAALHASVGLPPSLQVTEARANRLELKVQQNYRPSFYFLCCIKVFLFFFCCTQFHFPSRYLASWQLHRLKSPKLFLMQKSDFVLR